MIATFPTSLPKTVLRYLVTSMIISTRCTRSKKRTCHTFRSLQHPKPGKLQVTRLSQSVKLQTWMPTIKQPQQKTTIRLQPKTTMSPQAPIRLHPKLPQPVRSSTRWRTREEWTSCSCSTTKREPTRMSWSALPNLPTMMIDMSSNTMITGSSNSSNSSSHRLSLSLNKPRWK